MYHKWDITFCPHLLCFLRLFFVFLSSFFRLSFVNLIVIMPAFYPENRPLTSCALSVRRRRDYTHNGIFSDIPMCQNGIKSDGRRCQKRNRIDTFDDYDRRHTHTFPWVLLGFLHIFSNKKPLSSGFLKGFRGRSPTATSVSQVSHLSGTQSR